MNYYNYFTEIEEHFVSRRGKHLFVSPLDWSLITAWRDSGVPLHVALRGIDKAMDGFFAKQRRPWTKVNTLFFCHDSVMEEHSRYLETHLGEGAKTGPEEKVLENTAENEDIGAGPAKPDILAFLNRRIFEIKAQLAKQSTGTSAAEGLNRVASRLEEIARALEPVLQIDTEALERDLNILDELLVKELRSVIAPEHMAEWEDEAKKELKIYKKKLPKETYRKVLDNFLRGRIHKYCEIGELSLFHL